MPQAPHAFGAISLLAILALVAWTLLPLASVSGGSGAGAGGDADGWFTEAQADRGEEAYGEHCAECHAPDLRARGTYISLYNYPALTGTYFMDRWEGQSVLTLFEVIQHTMPLDAPNTLNADTYADITAHILRENGFPAGGTELPTAQMGSPRLDGLVIEQIAAAPAASPQNPEAVELRPREDSDDEAADDGANGAEDGEQVYAQNCAQCHGDEGEGGAGPALAGNEFLADAEATIDRILHGGGGMPAFRDELADAEVAAVASHIRTAWGNDFGEVAVDEVEARAGGAEDDPQDGEAEDGAGEEDGEAASAPEEVPAPWYTEDQASRARLVYMENCARCHGRALQGTGAAPSLAGGNFIARWDGESLDDLHYVVSALMPLDAPGSLEDDTYTDLIAYILQQNGFVAGESPLPTDAEALSRYVIRPDLADVPDVQ